VVALPDRAKMPTGAPLPAAPPCIRQRRLRAPVAFGKDARFGSEPRKEGFGPSVISGRPLNRFVEFLRWPGVHRTDYGLTTGINIHVLDGDLLLTLAAIALQCLNLRRKRPQ
jgi:hypothetical protein